MAAAFEGEPQEPGGEAAASVCAQKASGFPVRGNPKEHNADC